MALKTNYKDAVLDASENTTRVFDIVDDQGNVISANVHLEEKTVYSENGDKFGARDMNDTNEEINKHTSNLTDGYGGTDEEFRYGTDGNGERGYIVTVNGEDEFRPFKTKHTETVTPNSRALYDMGIDHKKRYIDLSAVPNINTTTRTISAVYTSGNGLDLGANNNVRYIKTSNLMVIPTSTKNITANGNNQDVLNYSKINVDVHPAIGASYISHAKQIGATSYAVGLSGHSRYLIVAAGRYANENIQASGCGATRLYVDDVVSPFGGYEACATAAFLCTSSGTCTVYSSTTNVLTWVLVIGLSN